MSPASGISEETTLAAVAEVLSCPVCGRGLVCADRVLRCPDGHSFDIARQGYVSLLSGAATKLTGDTAAMLEARAAFQGAGFFEPIATAVAEAAARSRPSGGAPGAAAVAEAAQRLRRAAGTPNTSAAEAQAAQQPRPAGGTPDVAPPAEAAPQLGAATGIPDTSAAEVAQQPGPAGSAPNASAETQAGQQLRQTGSVPDAPAEAMQRSGPVPGGELIADIGAGTGYYLARVLDALPGARGIALDLAKPAGRRCARAHPRAAAVVADAWRGLPVRDHTLTAALSVFAPRNPAAVARALAPGGRYLVVTPTDRHLAELIGPLGMVGVDPAKERRLADAMAGLFTRIDTTALDYPMTLTHADIAHLVAMGPSAHHTSGTGVARLPEPFEVTASVTVGVYVPTAALTTPQHHP